MRLSLHLQRTAYLVASFTLLFTQSSLAGSPQAVSVPFGPDFIGYDGLWSAAQIRVGTPEQYLLVLPSTTSSETWVAGPGICEDPTCASRRGGIFYTGNSSTWDNLGYYELGYSALTETTESGTYGFDDIAISDTLSASNQIIAVVDDIEQWVGHLGMGVAESRFQNNTNHLAFLSTLVQNNSAIPSHSYSYTAGASYKGSGTVGSLTLGGADTSRYTPNNFWFTLADGYVPSVALESMQISSSQSNVPWTSNPLEVYPASQAAMFEIDSSTPFLWLPEAVCENIAKALNLVWNSTIELYVFQNGTVQDRLNMGMEFTFNLAGSVGSNELIALKVSYNAFNLQLSYPFPGLFDSYTEDKVPYFPMRRANNTLQYTIGRAFLQEIYLIVDYERNSFSLSQALFPDNSQQPTLARITRPNGSGWPGPATSSGSSGLSTAAKIGIAVAIVVVACILTTLVWFCCLRNKKRRFSDDGIKTHKSSIFSMFSRRTTRKSSISGSAAELNADKTFPNEMHSDVSNSRFELPSTTPVEMAAGEVAPSFFQQRENARIAQKNDPRTPVELIQPPSRSSISKEEADARVREQRLASAPLYSTVNINQQHSRTNSSSANEVSPYSTRRGGLPSHGGSDHIISPITGSGSDPHGSNRGNLSHSGSDASRLLSPISPVNAQSDGHSSPRPSVSSETQSLTKIALAPTNRASLSPTPDKNTFPRRSPSRDSRFREELVDDVREETSSPIPQQQEQQQGRSSRASGRKPRFSWED